MKRVINDITFSLSRILNDSELNDQEKDAVIDIIGNAAKRLADL